MERLIRTIQGSLAAMCAGLGVAAAVVGCEHACQTCGVNGGRGNCQPVVDACADIPKGAIPRPIGTFTFEIFNRMQAKAEGDDFTIFYNEWVDNQAVLGPYGQEELQRIIVRLPAVPFPVIVQPEPDRPILNGLRQQAIINALMAAGIPNAIERVVIGRPAGEGLFGDEAERIYPQLISGGASGVPGGAGFGGAIPGAGFAGAGFAGSGIGGLGVAGGGYGAFGGGGFGR
jgi:hypothetical protein